jgi:predicted nuclease of predicted toxin-antitoxin system
MRFLADAGISAGTVEFLRLLGHEADHVGSLGLARALDTEIVARARADSSVIITFDLDFGDLLALGVLDRPSVVLLRLADERAVSVNEHLASVLTDRLHDLEAGSMTSSMVMPSSMFSKTTATGVRVPRNTQAPLTLPGMLSTTGHYDQSSEAIDRPPSGVQFTGYRLGRHVGITLPCSVCSLRRAKRADVPFGGQ